MAVTYKRLFHLMIDRNISNTELISKAGVSANIFGTGFPRNFIPSFSWGGAAGFTTYLTVKAFETARLVMNRRGLEFDEREAAILEHVFEESKKWRKE